MKPKGPERFKEIGDLFGALREACATLPLTVSEQAAIHRHLADVAEIVLGHAKRGDLTKADD